MYTPNDTRLRRNSELKLEPSSDIYPYTISLNPWLLISTSKKSLSPTIAGTSTTPARRGKVILQVTFESNTHISTMGGSASGGIKVPAEAAGGRSASGSIERDGSATVNNNQLKCVFTAYIITSVTQYPVPGTLSAPGADFNIEAFLAEYGTHYLHCVEFGAWVQYEFSFQFTDQSRLDTFKANMELSPTTTLDLFKAQLSGRKDDKLNSSTRILRIDFKGIKSLPPVNVSSIDTLCTSLENVCKALAEFSEAGAPLYILYQSFNEALFPLQKARVVEAERAITIEHYRYLANLIHDVQKALLRYYNFYGTDNVAELHELKENIDILNAELMLFACYLSRSLPLKSVLISKVNELLPKILRAMKVIDEKNLLTTHDVLKLCCKVGSEMDTPPIARDWAKDRIKTSSGKGEWFFFNLSITLYGWVARGAYSDAVNAPIVYVMATESEFSLTLEKHPPMSDPVIKYGDTVKLLCDAGTGSTGRYASDELQAAGFRTGSPLQAQQVFYLINIDSGQALTRIDNRNRDFKIDDIAFFTLDFHRHYSNENRPKSSAVLASLATNLISLRDIGVLQLSDLKTTTAGVARSTAHAFLEVPAATGAGTEYVR